MDTKKQIINFNLLFTAAVNKNNNDSLEQNAKIEIGRASCRERV